MDQLSFKSPYQNEEAIFRLIQCTAAIPTQTATNETTKAFTAFQKKQKHIATLGGEQKLIAEDENVNFKNQKPISRPRKNFSWRLAISKALL